MPKFTHLLHACRLYHHFGLLVCCLLDRSGVKVLIPFSDWWLVTRVLPPLRFVCAVRVALFQWAMSSRSPRNRSQRWSRRSRVARDLVKVTRASAGHRHTAVRFETLIDDECLARRTHEPRRRIAHISALLYWWIGSEGDAGEQYKWLTPTGTWRHGVSWTLIFGGLSRGGAKILGPGGTSDKIF